MLPMPATANLPPPAAPWFVRFLRPLGLAGALLTLGACTSLPATTGETPPTHHGIWRPSDNWDERRPNYVIIHHTSNTNPETALRTLTSPVSKASAHYLIGRDGTRYQLVDEAQRAWHAGESYWGGQTDMNSASLGIELDNTGAEPFPPAQVDALIALLDEVIPRHRIPAINVLGHGDVAPRRKVDPSAYFPWERLAERGYGLWCEPALRDIFLSRGLPGESFDPWLALQALGYSPADPVGALQAFHRHFRGMEGSEQPDATDRALLACLLHKRAGTLASALQGDSANPLR